MCTWYNFLLDVCTWWQWKAETNSTELLINNILKVAERFFWKTSTISAKRCVAATYQCKGWQSQKISNGSSKVTSLA